jgi:hypothetical protein
MWRFDSGGLTDASDACELGATTDGKLAELERRNPCAYRYVLRLTNSNCTFKSLFCSAAQVNEAPPPVHHATMVEVLQQWPELVSSAVKDGSVHVVGSAFSVGAAIKEVGNQSWIAYTDALAARFPEALRCA